MAWYQCVGSINRAKASSFKYLRWKVSKVRGSVNLCQLSDLRFVSADGTNYEYPEDMFLQSNLTQYNDKGEKYMNLFDNNASTKGLATNFTTDEGWTLDIYISSAPLNIKEFLRFEWYTANDGQDRDPVSWELYGANELDFSDAVLLNSEEDYSVTTNRGALAYSTILSI